MFFRLLLLLFCVGSLGAAITNNDPSEEFVAAYRSFKEAERLDQAGRKDEAIAKYRYAESHLIDISNNYPNWQKPIVEYRLSKIRNNLARINTSSSSGEPPAYSNDARSVNDTDRPVPSDGSSDTPRSYNSEQREEPSYAQSRRESLRYGAEPPSADVASTSRPIVSDSENIEPVPQASSRRASDIPTLSIVPPAARNTPSNKELIQLQKQLKRTESQLEKAHNDIIDKTTELDQSKVSLVEAKAQLAKTERQLVDLKNDLEKNRTGSLQREAVLKKSVEQLKEKVAALSADKEVILEENSNLQQHLQQATNSLSLAFNNKNRLEQLQVEVNAEKNASAALHEQLSAAQRERDEAHAESATLAQQVKQVNASLIEAQKKNAEIDALKVRLANLKEEGASKEKMLIDAREASKKLQASQKHLIEDFQKKLTASQADQEVLNEERANMEIRLKQTREEVAALKKSGTDAAALQHRIAALTQELEKNKKQLSDAQASEMETATIQKQALVELDEKYRVAIMERQKTEIRKGELEQQLAAINNKIKSLESQSSDTAALQNSLQQSQTELQAAKTQLQASEKKIAALEKVGPERDHFLQNKEKELAAARDEAGKFQKELLIAQQQLTSIQQELKTKDDRYNELKKQLNQKNEEMIVLQKKGTPEGGQEKVIAENELLKGIVLRELKAEARRQQLRKLVMEDLDKLKVKSETLSLELRKLARPVKLTPEERALFKDKLPLPPETGQEEDKLVVAVEASKVGTNTPSGLVTTNMPMSVGTNNVTGETGTNAITELTKKEKGAKKESPIDQEKYHAAINKAKNQFEHQNYTEAEKSFQDALSASPNDYITLSNLGVVEFQLGKMTDAEMILKKACAEDPKKSFAFTTLGIVHYRQERFDDAEKVLRQAVAINDQDFTAHNYLGIVLAASGKSKAGESEIIKSIELNPNYADAHFNLAVIYATGKPPAKEMAKVHYKKAVSLGAPADQALEKLIYTFHE